MDGENAPVHDHPMMNPHNFGALRTEELWSFGPANLPLPSSSMIKEVWRSRQELVLKEPTSSSHMLALAERYPNVKRIIVKDHRCLSREWLDSLTAFPRLKHLSVLCMRWNEPNKMLIGRFTALRSLEINTQCFSHAEFGELLTSLRRLKRLTIRTDAWVLQYIRAFPSSLVNQLEHLKIKTGVLEYPSRAMHAIPIFPQLKSFDCSSMKCTDRADMLLPMLYQKMPALNELRVYCEDMNWDGNQYGLKRLSLETNTVNTPAARNFPRNMLQELQLASEPSPLSLPLLRSQSRLKTLCITCHAADLSFLPATPNLHTLKIHSDTLPIDQLDFIRKSPELKHLTIDSRCEDEQGLRLVDFPFLETLRVRNANHLLEIRQCPNLRKLRVGKPMFDASANFWLEDLPKLKKVWCTNLSVWQRTIESLGQLPALEKMFWKNCRTMEQPADPQLFASVTKWVVQNNAWVEPPIQLLPVSPHLKEYSSNRESIRPEDFYPFQEIESLKLFFGQNDSYPVSFRTMQSLRNLSLHLAITKRGVLDLTGLRNLRRLYLQMPKFIFTVFKGWETLEELHTLRLVGRVESIKPLAKLPLLQQLEIVDDKMKLKQFQELLQLPRHWNVYLMTCPPAMRMHNPELFAALEEHFAEFFCMHEMGVFTFDTPDE